MGGQKPSRASYQTVSGSVPSAPNGGAYATPAYPAPAAAPAAPASVASQPTYAEPTPSEYAPSEAAVSEADAGETREASENGAVAGVAAATAGQAYFMAKRTTKYEQQNKKWYKDGWKSYKYNWKGFTGGMCGWYLMLMAVVLTLFVTVLLIVAATTTHEERHRWDDDDDDDDDDDEWRKSLSRKVMHLSHKVMAKAPLVSDALRVPTPAEIEADEAETPSGLAAKELARRHRKPGHAARRRGGLRRRSMSKAQHAMKKMHKTAKRLARKSRAAAAVAGKRHGHGGHGGHSGHGKPSHDEDEDEEENVWDDEDDVDADDDDEDYSHRKWDGRHGRHGRKHHGHHMWHHFGVVLNLGALLMQMFAGIFTSMIIGPMLASIFFGHFKYQRGDAVTARDMFTGFRFFRSVYPAYLLAHVAGLIGTFFFYLPGLYIQCASFFVIPLAIEHPELGAARTLRLSIALFNKQFGYNLLVVLPLALLNVLSAMVSFGILLVVTVPISVGVIAVMYKDVLGVDGAVEDPEAAHLARVEARRAAAAAATADPTFVSLDQLSQQNQQNAAAQYPGLVQQPVMYAQPAQGQQMSGTAAPMAPPQHMVVVPAYAAPLQYQQQQQQQQPAPQQPQYAAPQ